MLAPLLNENGLIPLTEPLTEADYRLLARVIAEHPSVGFYVYQDLEGHFRDLDFLRHFTGLRQLHVRGLRGLRDVGGLEYVAPDLETLSIGELRRFRLSLGFLRSCRRLRRLEIEGHTRDIEAIGELNELRELKLRSITLPDLALLKPLSKLESLDLKLGGIRDLRHLPEIGRLRYFEAWRIRGLEDLSPLAGVTTLQKLFLQTLNRVTDLPEMGRLELLRSVSLEALKGVRDLAPLARAPALEQLWLFQMDQLQPKDLAVLLGHPTLRELNVWLGSERKRREVDRLFPPAEFEWTGKFEFR